MFLPGTMDSIIISYVVTPMLWISLGIISFLLARYEGLNIWSFKKVRNWSIGRSAFEAALLVGGFQISLLIIAGLLIGFAKSPYLFTPQSILLSTLFFSSAVFGIELSRAYFIKKGPSKSNITLTIAIVTILYMFIRLNLSDILLLDTNNPSTIIIFLGGTIIPLFTISLFTSYIIYLGGGLAGIGFMMLIQSFQYYSPIQPDLPWILSALIQTIAPVIGFVIIQNSVQQDRKKYRKKKKRLVKKDPTLSWAWVGILSVIFVFFSFGYLGVQPTIISSGSMRPALDVGDIVIITEITIDDIREDDIIQYKIGNISNVHRVHEIKEDEGSRYFITKGDANNAPDVDPVNYKSIMGKAVFNIPKVGWIPLIFRRIIGGIGITI
jgi:signal peptidase